jgi:predicted TIM-barrel fold metal-dependent hydrolase
MHVSLGVGIEGAPTPAGHTRTYAHYAAYMPLNYFHHLVSLILDGSFVRIPDFRVVFADGGIDILTPLIWRLDTFWRAMREQTPWVDRMPSSYLAEHVRFVFSVFEGFPDPAVASDWLDLTGKTDMLMFGSNYPFRTLATPGNLADGLLDSQRDAILFANAANFYGLTSTVTSEQKG